MINIGIFGATGYTGVETLRLLQRHGHARLAFAHSDSNAGMRLSDVIACPYDVPLIKADDAPLDKVDVVFSCLPHGPSAELCARKIALRGVDPETARTWVTIEPAATRGWQALADADGDEHTSAEEARFLAALTHPFSPRSLEAAGRGFPLEAGALSGAMAHVFLDPRWRWIDPADRDAFEANGGAWSPAPSRRVTWTRPARVSFEAIDTELAKVLGFAQPLAITRGATVTGPPPAPRGPLSPPCRLGPGPPAPRAILEPPQPVPRSRAVAVCHTNCEDRLSSFGLAWLGPQQQVVWRSSLTGEVAAAVRTPIELDVIDGGDGTWGDSIVRALGG